MLIPQAPLQTQEAQRALSCALKTEVKMSNQWSGNQGAGAPSLSPWGACPGGGLSVPSHTLTAWIGHTCPALHTEDCNKHTPARQIESVDAPPTVRLEKTDGCDG